MCLINRPQKETQFSKQRSWHFVSKLFSQVFIGMFGCFTSPGRSFKISFFYKKRLINFLNCPAFFTYCCRNCIQPDRPALEFICLLYTSPSPRDRTRSRMPS